MGKTKQAREILPLVSKEIQDLAIARLSLRRRSKNSKKLVAAVDNELLDHPGLHFEQIRWLRRHRKHKKARDLMFKAPKTLGRRPDMWWKERRLQIRYWLAKKNFGTAYELAKSHKQKTGDRGYGEAEWLAGWLALRFRKRPGAALGHFQAFAKTVNYPISVARANYWIGRTKKSNGDTVGAKLSFQIAAAHGGTYYGQLATEALGGAARWNIQDFHATSFDEQRIFETRELVQVLRFLHNANLKKQMRPFFLHMAWTSSDLHERRMIAKLAVELEAPGIAVRVGKVGALRSDPPSAMGHPHIDLLNADVEPALVYALIRQESEFREKVSSHVGASGLMQIMPRTGRSLAKKLNLPFTRIKLYEAEYNMTLGTKYLADLIARYNGSYIMAVAAYNAGEHRVDRWIENFGDPRVATTNSIDWMEKIPFYETRNYVQRVMENLQIYRWKATKSAKINYPLVAQKIKQQPPKTLPAAAKSRPKNHQFSLNAVLIQPRLKVSQPGPNEASKISGIPVVY